MNIFLPMHWLISLYGFIDWSDPLRRSTATIKPVTSPNQRTKWKVRIILRVDPSRIHFMMSWVWRFFPLKRFEVCMSQIRPGVDQIRSEMIHHASPQEMRIVVAGFSKTPIRNYLLLPWTNNKHKVFIGLENKCPETANWWKTSADPPRRPSLRRSGLCNLHL